jgi:selenoprotein W-related protein
LAEELTQALQIKSELIPGDNGVFDVLVDGKLVFSRKEEGRFPEEEEVIRRLIGR